jgi:hypothetical protein
MASDPASVVWHDSSWALVLVSVLVRSAGPLESSELVKLPNCREFVFELL